MGRTRRAHRGGAGRSKRKPEPIPSLFDREPTLTRPERKSRSRSPLPDNLRPSPDGDGYLGICHATHAADGLDCGAEFWSETVTHFCSHHRMKRNARREQLPEAA